MNVDEGLRRYLDIIGTLLRLHFEDKYVSGPIPSAGGDAVRFDIQEGTENHRLWVRYDFQWVAVTDIASLLESWNTVGRLREAGTSGSVVLTTDGAFVSAQRKPAGLGE